MSEYLLATMFNVPPFKPRIGMPRELPFYFVWYPEKGAKATSAGFPSHFALSADDLENGQQNGRLEMNDRTLPRDIRKRKAQAFVIENKVYPVRWGTDDWTDFGVICVQKRNDGRVLMVIGGLSGPATLATARVLDSINDPVPEPKAHGRHSPIMYVVVEVTVKRVKQSLKADPREIVNQRVILGPKLWEENA